VTDSGTNGRVESLEVVVLAPSTFDPGVIEQLVDAAGEEHCQFVDSPDQFSELGTGADCRVVLYRPQYDARQVRELAERQPLGDETATVCVVDSGEWRTASAEVRRGASDYLFADELGSSNLETKLRAAGARPRGSTEEEPSGGDFTESSSDLAGMNAPAEDVSIWSDREEIVRRGLRVFAEVSGRDAVALVEARPSEDRLEEGERDGGEGRYLARTDSFSPGDIELVESRFDLGGGWPRILRENRVVELRGRPAEWTVPGLEPFWNQYPEGRVTIAPLGAGETPIGAVVLADLEESSGLGISRSGLGTMTSHFGATLHNARLFEQIRAARDSLRETQDQLVHAEKYAAVGMLAAEIAHEINNPASFVISNLSVMDEYADSITSFLDEIEEWVAEHALELEDSLEELKSDHEIEYLRDDMDSLLSRSLSGMQRIHQIVQDLRYLSREQDEKPEWVELEGLLDSTINLVRHEAKFRAEVERSYGDVPQVLSDSGQLSQVFLNLLVNAVQAIEEGGVEENFVRISTEESEGGVVVSIEDSGEGIPPDLQDQIFEPFFTTKETGEGTGLGLSISRDIVRSLGGSIDFETEPGEGTTFRVRLPVRAEKFERDRDLRDSGYYDTPPGLDEVSDEIFDP